MLSVYGLCWFVFLICSLIIGVIVCLAVCLMRFVRCLNLLSVLGFDVIGLIFGVGFGVLVLVGMWSWGFVFLFV